METTQNTQPNARLRRQRLLRGWSLKHVVEQLCTLCGEEEEIPGVTPDMVSKWERGERKPSHFYQTKFCLLYNTTADQLGFLETLDISDLPQTHELRSAITSPSFIPSSSTSTKAIDALLDHNKEETSEVLASHLLVLSSRQLATLTTLGWTQRDIMSALQIVLQGESAMANMNRRKVLQLGAGLMLLGGVDLLAEEHPSAQKRAELSQNLAEGIVAGWTLFHTTGTAQVLAVSQSQIALIQQAHSMLYPDTIPYLNSGAYRLMGAALYFQGRYKEAYTAHDLGYLAAIESHDAWNIAESLSWEAYVYQECGQHTKAIEAIDEALRRIGNRTDEAALRLKAHLLACWAENAMKLRHKHIAEKKLEASEALLDLLTPNEEFDRTKWHQQAGNCAVGNGDYTTAASHFQKALESLPQHWTLRHAITLIPLAATYAQLRERDKSLEVAEKAIPVLVAMNATLMHKQFAEYVQHNLLNAFPNDSKVQRFIADAQQRLPQLN
jgi:tetratricopeptide (TPR) repeat protein/transcriptional regulator with XRE-family HTH domain